MELRQRKNGNPGLKRQPSYGRAETLRARAAIAMVVTRCATWHVSLARLRGQAARNHSAHIEHACSALLAEVAGARSDLLENLMDAPSAVRTHSRVTDVERTLDAIEATARNLQSRSPNALNLHDDLFI